MPKVLILNGPNLNVLGKREPHIYGDLSFELYFERLQSRFKALELEYFQSNHEGELIDRLQTQSAEALVVNFGALTHTSLALADALAYQTVPIVEVHISNLYAREDFRQKSLTAPHCKGVITGLGLEGYHLAVSYLSDWLLKT
jgi:3-dehydroquinate dehydratase-2